MSHVKQNFRARSFRLLATSVLLLAMSVGVAAQEEDAGNAGPRTGVINGRVVNDNGQPVPRATVYVGAPMDMMQSRTTTTDDG
jgi:hypothetical protein